MNTPASHPMCTRTGARRAGLRVVGALPWALAGLLGLASGTTQAITGDTDTASFLAVGQGVQIAPDWVLTVYHYALNPTEAYTNGYNTRTVAARYDAPGSAAGFPANDLSLLRLAPAVGSGAVPLLAVQGDLVPYGVLSPALNVTIASSASGSPRAYGHTTVTESVAMVDPDDAGPLPAVTANWLISLDSTVHVQGGDSGGGLFLGHVSDSSVLLGLSSGLLQEQTSLPGVLPPVYRDVGSGFVQPAAYRSWIDNTMATDVVDAQLVNWVSAVPEPATWALWGLGAAMLWAARSRRARG